VATCKRAKVHILHASRTESRAYMAVALSLQAEYVDGAFLAIGDFSVLVGHRLL